MTNAMSYAQEVEKAHEGALKRAEEHLSNPSTVSGMTPTELKKLKEKTVEDLIHSMLPEHESVFLQLLRLISDAELQ